MPSTTAITTSQPTSSLPLTTENTSTSKPDSETSVLFDTLTSPAIPPTWQQWTEWGSCHKSCDINLRKRTRECSSDGSCNGEREEGDLCETQPCKGDIYNLTLGCSVCV